MSLTPVIISPSKAHRFEVSKDEASTKDGPRVFGVFFHGTAIVQALGCATEVLSQPFNRPTGPRGVALRRLSSNYALYSCLEARKTASAVASNVRLTSRSRLHIRRHRICFASSGSRSSTLPRLQRTRPGHFSCSIYHVADGNATLLSAQHGVKKTR